MLDPTALLMLATGTLLLLNGLIARAAAAKSPEASEIVEASSQELPKELSKTRA